MIDSTQRAASLLHCSCGTFTSDDAVYKLFMADDTITIILGGATTQHHSQGTMVIACAYTTFCIILYPFLFLHNLDDNFVSEGGRSKSEIIL